MVAPPIRRPRRWRCFTPLGVGCGRGLLRCGPRVGLVCGETARRCSTRHDLGSRPARRRRRSRGQLGRRRGGASGNRSWGLRGDGTLQISKIADGRGAIDLPAGYCKLALDGALIICLLYRGELSAVGDGSLEQIGELVGQGFHARPRYFPTHRGGATDASDTRRNLSQGVEPVAALGSVSGPGAATSMAPTTTNTN